MVWSSTGVYSANVFILVLCFVCGILFSFFAVEGSLGPVSTNDNLPFSRMLEEPFTIDPHFSPNLGAFVTEVELHVRLRRLSVPLFLNEVNSKSGLNSVNDDHDLSSSPSHLFTYTGRFYELNQSSEFIKNSNESGFLRSVVPGPTLRVVPGGYLRLRLVNDLEGINSDGEMVSLKKHDDNDCNATSCSKETKPFPLPMFYTMHHPNITNMHFHGLHCDPHIDDPFLTLLPRPKREAETQHQINDKLKSEHEYLVPILHNHAPGLHWYHAHSHGSVYLQLMGGLFGALIVDERPNDDSETASPANSFFYKKDRIPSSFSPQRPWLASTTPSRLLVFHLFRLSSTEGKKLCDGQTMDELDKMISNTVQPSHPKITPLGVGGLPNKTAKDSLSIVPNLFLVNGQHRPVVIVEEGKPTTIRMLYAAGSCHLNLSFPCTTESSLCPGSSTESPSTNPIHRCYVVPRAADGVPLDLSVQDYDYSLHNAIIPPSQAFPLKNMSSSDFLPLTSWLYFTAATRHEVVIFCNRTDNAEENHTTHSSRTQAPEYPVQNQDNETIFFIQVSPGKKSTDETPLPNDPSAEHHRKAMQSRDMKDHKENASWFEGKKTLSAHDDEIMLRSILFPTFPKCVEEENERSIDCVLQHVYFVKPPEYLQLPPLRGSKEAHHGKKMRNASSLAAASSVFRWSVSLSQRYVVDSSPYKTSMDRPFYVIGEGSDCSQDNERLRGTQSHSPGDRSRDTKRDNKEDSYNHSQCYFHPFEGPRGDKNLSAYHGFVSPYDEVIEVHIFGDPTDSIPHPFHFHVNHFQFISFVPRPGGVHEEYTDNLRSFGLTPGEWRDTIPILDGETVLRWRAANFSGEILYHCHMLSHEDRGMMSSYYVLPPTIDLKDDRKADWLTAIFRQDSHIIPFLAIALSVLVSLFLYFKKWRRKNSSPSDRSGESNTEFEKTGLYSSGSRHRYGATDL